MFHKKTNSLATISRKDDKNNQQTEQSEAASKSLISALHSKNEVNWLYFRIDQIRMYFLSAIKHINTSKISKKEKKIAIADIETSLESLAGLKERMEKIEAEVDSNYKQDAEWQSLHGIVLSPISKKSKNKEKEEINDMWEAANFAKVRGALSEEKKLRLDYLTRLRNQCIFERLTTEVLLNEFSTIQKDGYKGSLKYALFLRHTLWEISENAALMIDVSDLINMVNEYDAEEKKVDTAKVNLDLKFESNDSYEVEKIIQGFQAFPTVQKTPVPFLKAQSYSEKASPRTNNNLLFGSQRIAAVCPEVDTTQSAETSPRPSSNVFFQAQWVKASVTSPSATSAGQSAEKNVNQAAGLTKGSK